MSKEEFIQIFSHGEALRARRARRKKEGFANNGFVRHRRCRLCVLGELCEIKNFEQQLCVSAILAPLREP